jgi:hypothetical protein
LLARTVGATSSEAPHEIDLKALDGEFAFRCDHVLAETAGIERNREPVEITLSVAGNSDPSWSERIRVVCVRPDGRGIVVPHQVLGRIFARSEGGTQETTPVPAQSANVLFLADCPAQSKVVYRLLWGDVDGRPAREHPAATNDAEGLVVRGDTPGLQVTNAFYDVQLDPNSGAIRTARLANRPESENLYYGSIPIHFGVDVWSPPQAWDHDYDWESPPKQTLEVGPLAARYHRWGPLQHYHDVMVSVTYTFYAHIPYIYITSTMEFTENRSVRAVRMGEIVVSHTRQTEPNEKDTNEKDTNEKARDVFTHYAWPNKQGDFERIAINDHRDSLGAANLPGLAAGALAVLDRDVPWVAGYHETMNYGLATLRRAQFAGNRLGGPVPLSAPCTILANYGWGFTYWSRPFVYPPGLKGTPEDQNSAVAAGTIFAVEEALLFFTPQDSLNEVANAHRRFAQPLQHVFQGTGPW